MSFVLIVNPYSGEKQSSKILTTIKPFFDSKGVRLSVIETAFPGHARELAACLSLDEYDGLLALGGDGTFHEIVNGMLGRHDGKTTAIGMIPGGTGNSVLHDLGLEDHIKATEAIIAGHTRPMDVARIEMNHIVRYSVNLIGWGLVTDIGKRAERLRWLGPKRYTIASIIEILLKTPRSSSLIVDGETHDGDFIFIIACNSVHIGGKMKMAPNAKLDDGLIDLVVVESDITRRRLLSVLPQLFQGTHINEPEVNYYQASSFSLLPKTNDSLNIDGEMLGSTPITVTMIQNAIEIFA